jgi:hypothetical protein
MRRKVYASAFAVLFHKYLANSLLYHFCSSSFVCESRHKEPFLHMECRPL